MAVRAAAQDHGVARFERERAGIGGDVRAALVDHANDAKRHLDALDGHAVRPRPGLSNPADRIGKVAHHVEAFGHRHDALVIQGEPVERGCGQAGGFTGGKILCVGSEDLGFAGADRRRHTGQRAILLVGRGLRQHAGGSLRPLADVAHGCGDIARSFDGLQRRGHGSYLCSIRLFLSLIMSGPCSHLRAGMRLPPLFFVRRGVRLPSFPSPM